MTGATNGSGRRKAECPTENAERLTPLPEPEPPQPPTGGALRDAWHRYQDWWSPRRTTGQLIAAVIISMALGAMAWAADSPALTGVFSNTTISWAHGTYTVTPHCTNGGIVPMKIDNNTSGSTVAEVEAPGYAQGYGRQPLYPAENSHDPHPNITVPANGSITIYLKLGDKSWECSNAATDALKVVPDGSAHSNR